MFMEPRRGYPDKLKSRGYHERKYTRSEQDPSNGQEEMVEILYWTNNNAHITRWGGDGE